jgi:hypothetical protein
VIEMAAPCRSVRIRFRSPLRPVILLVGTNKIGSAGKDRRISNPCEKSLC